MGSKQRGNSNITNRLSIADRTALLSTVGTREGEVILQNDIGLLYTWTETQGIDNGGTVINSGTGSWIAKYSGALNVKWFGAKGDGVTDDSAKIELALIIVRASADDDTKYVENVLFPPGDYYIGTGLNFTDIRNNTLLDEGTVTIFGYGAVLLANCAGTAAMDFTRTRSLKIKGITVVGDVTNTPMCGIQLARGNNSETASNIQLVDVHCRGWYTRASLYNMASEAFSALTCDFANNETDKYCVIIDGVNFYGNTSEFYTVTTTQFQTQSNIQFTFDNCIIGQGKVGTTRKGTQLIEADKVRFNSCYLITEGAAGIEVATYNDNHDHRTLYFDIHLETTSFFPLYLVDFTNLSGSALTGVSIKDFTLIEHNSHATTAQIGNNTGGILKFLDSYVNIINTRPESSNIVFSNNEIEYYGDINWGDGDIPTGIDLSKFYGKFTSTHDADVLSLPTSGEYIVLDTNGDKTYSYGGGGLDALSFSFDTIGDLAVVYNSNEVKYQKVGNICFFNCYMSFTPTYTTSAGNVRISGLPFVSVDASTTNHMGIQMSEANQSINYPTGATSLSGRIKPNVSFIELTFTYSDGVNGTEEMDINAFTSGSLNAFRLSGFYIIKQ